MLLPNEWRWLKEVTEVSPARFGMCGRDRMLSYATAIQTGLRSNELRSLRVADLYLSHSPPFVTVQARSTRNKQVARQYVQTELAVALREHVMGKPSGAAAFDLPKAEVMARMIRGDLADARSAWLEDAAGDPKERARREASDFLATSNDNGETPDLHSPRHACGAWLALSGAHPKAIQAVMRHSTIVLTMGTYGHPIPGQEAETVARLPLMFATNSNVPQGVSSDETGGLVAAGMVAGSIDIPCLPVMTADASQASGTPSRRGGKALENKGTDDRGVRLTTIAAKLPGLDSNQDEQNQNRKTGRWTFTHGY